MELAGACVHHQTTFNMFLPNYKSKKLKIFCAFRAAFGKQSNPETLKWLPVCFALTCKLILMECSVSHNETDIQKISKKKKNYKKTKKDKKIRSNGPSMKLLQMKE